MAKKAARRSYSQAKSARPTAYETAEKAVQAAMAANRNEAIPRHTLPQDILDLPNAVTTVNTKLNWLISIGVFCIGGGAFALWDISGKLGDIRETIGKIDHTQVQTSDPVITQKLEDILKELKAQNLPLEIQKGDLKNWPGAVAKDPVQLDAFLAALKAKSSKDPVFVYTTDAGVQDILKDVAQEK